MYNTKGIYKKNNNKLDENTLNIMMDRMRFQKRQGKHFHEFLDTIDWKQEKWIEKYERSDDAVRDLLDLWYEVDEV